jgi:membrane-associated phospholipid phosphatase
MSVPADRADRSNYLSRFFELIRLSVTQLVRSPSHARRADAARRLARHVVILTAILGIAIIAFMYMLDVPEISAMPSRDAPGLRLVRILTDAGKAAFVLWSLAGLLFVVAILSARSRDLARSLLPGLGMRLQYLFFAVLVPVLAGEIAKWIVGRGRPFVGGKANSFNFVHFAGTEAYFSFPSAHAITAFALAFAVSTIWPQAWLMMALYALLVAASRLVLLAHHPSDVVAGALVGVVGAMFVRYWFAARRLGFAISPDGTISPLGSPSFGRSKRVARGPSSP